MKQRLIHEAVESLASAQGVRACALVDGDSGMIWHAVDGGVSRESVWEAAIDFWRLHRRNQDHFAELGDLGAVLLHHTGGVLAMLPCAAHEDLLLICVAEHGSVKWLEWQRRVRDLAENLKHAQTRPPD
jgi:hypothetical protein